MNSCPTEIKIQFAEISTDHDASRMCPLDLKQQFLYAAWPLYTHYKCNIPNSLTTEIQSSKNEYTFDQYKANEPHSLAPLKNWVWGLDLCWGWFWIWDKDCFGSGTETVLDLGQRLFWIWDRDCFGSGTETVLDLGQRCWIWDRDCFGSATETVNTVVARNYEEKSF